MDYRELFGRKTVTQSGIYLGKIFNIELELNTDEIVFIHVTPPLLHRLRYGTFVIHRDEIIRIEPKQVVVKDTVKRLPGFLQRCRQLFSAEPSAIESENSK